MAFAVSLLAAAIAAGADPGYSSRPLAAFRAAAAPNIDGKLDDALWKQAPRAATFIDGVTDGPAEEQTEAWLAYDDKAIYVAFHCHDRKPAEIVAREVRYGATLSGDDSVSFTVDPYYNRGSGESSFAVNARGTQQEYISGGRAAKREWSGVWQAAVQRIPDGWTAEMRIPWQILPHPGGRKTVKMGVNFWRYQARTQVNSMWSSLTRSYRPELVGIWQGVETPGGAVSPLRWLTYGTGELGGSGAGSPRSGMDLRYTPSQQLSSVVSLFPDFRNVEQAVEGIQFSRTERYLSESRPFFQEGAEYFPGAFYSRRIETFDVGTKAFGRIGPHFSYGLLGLMRGDQEGDMVAQTSYTLGEKASASLYSMVGRGGRPQNEQAGMTLSTRYGNFYTGGELNRARTGADGGSEMAVRTGWGDGHWALDLGYNDTSPNYAPALGYVGFIDSRVTSLGGGYSADWRHGPLRSFNISGYGDYSTRYSGATYARSASFGIYLLTRSNYQLAVSKSLGDFEGAVDSVWGVRLIGNANNRRARWYVGYNWGELSSARSSFWTLGFARRLFRKMDIGIGSSLRQDVERREQVVGTIGWEIDARRAISSRVVQTDGKLNWYMAYRNAGGLGHETYLILGDPNAARFTRRVALKWVWAK